MFLINYKTLTNYDYIISINSILYHFTLLKTVTSYNIVVYKLAYKLCRRFNFFLIIICANQKIWILSKIILKKLLYFFFIILHFIYKIQGITCLFDNQYNFYSILIQFLKQWSYQYFVVAQDPQIDQENWMIFLSTLRSVKCVFVLTDF